MKVFEINVVYDVGSTGRIAAQLKHGVEADGGECIAAYGRGLSKEENTYHIGSTADVYYHVAMTRITDRAGLYSSAATQKLCKKITEFAPDVIHLHNLHGYYLNVELLFEFLKSYGKPVIWTLHDCWAFTGHCAYFTDAHCEQWRSHCQKCPLKSRYPASWMADNCRDNFERKKNAFCSLPKLTIVTPSQWLADLVRQSFLSDYPIKVVYNGIDTGQFRYTPSDFRKTIGAEGKMLLLGVSGVWDRRKGLDDFMELSEELDERYQIVLVGLNKRQLRGLPNRMIGLGHTDSVKQLAQIYSAADYYLNLSREETFGLTVAEAIACNTLPIVYEGTACAEVVRQSAGKVIPREKAALVEAVSSRRSNEPAESIQESAQIFSNERFLKEMLEIYREAGS